MVAAGCLSPVFHRLVWYTDAHLTLVFRYNGLLLIFLVTHLKTDCDSDGTKPRVGL